MNSGKGLRRVSSPTSTGSAGTFFEQHVDATLLSLLLVRGIPPILTDCTVREVHFQTEHLGWNTDDFLIIGETGSGDQRKLVGQVKRTLLVSSTNDECQKTISDCWQDYCQGSVFSAENDRFAIVTLRGTDTLLAHFSGLFDCARFSQDAADFEHRMCTPGFVHQKVAHYAGEIRKIVEAREGKRVEIDKLWQFMKLLHVLSFDLNTATCQTEAWIRTLLAHTATTQNPQATAQTTWNALLIEAGEGMPHAKSYSWGDLPESVRNGHSQIGGNEQRALTVLNQHSLPILENILTSLGPGTREVHLPRSKIIDGLIEQLELTQVVLVTGVAGCGKSSVAKNVMDRLAADHFAFAFRAEEFSSPHLDETLMRAQIPTNTQTLSALLAGQSRKILLVESVERLLEASVRDAFVDLLNLLRRDNSWRLILTCRSYSADLVRSSFLEYAGINHAVVAVPLLDDSELTHAETTCPGLSRPLSNPAFRRLLRNPYLLDKASRMPWPEDRPLPETERSFRLKFWQDVVRVNHRAADGMPRRREQAFLEVALRRARALTLHGPCDDLDPAILDRLRLDSLIVSPETTDTMAAPAHDVLEDWALLHWIGIRFEHGGQSVAALADDLGAYPAIRRAYRKWLVELVEVDRNSTDDLFRTVTTNDLLPSYFRDDTLVSLLRSSGSAELLERHHSLLFGEKRNMLRRVIHLLRVGCVKKPEWLKADAASAFMFHIPDGPAWASVLSLVSRHLDEFSLDENSLLLGFIEDWAKGVSWQSPYPNGAASTATIAHWLLPNFSDYRSEDPRKRTLQVIVKIPLANKEKFLNLLTRDAEEKRRDPVRDDLVELVLDGMEGMPACRDLPDDTIALANTHFRLQDDDEEDKHGYFADSLSMEPLFGLSPHLHLNFFPASAYRGPFSPLLRYHPKKGMDFIIHLFNHSAEWYGHPRYSRQFVEPPFPIILSFSDGTTQTQWCNARLWNLYRGTSVGPYVLQTALMSLEHWLFELAEFHPQNIEHSLPYLLRNSQCAAITSVVASFATAHPRLAGEALLVLLQSRECMLLDRQRMASEASSPSGVFNLMPSFDALSKVYQEERKQSDQRPHRRSDLETAILNLQLTQHRNRVWEILDAHRASLPEINQQDDADRIWRLALHRMDLRLYNVSDAPPNATVSEDDDNDAEGNVKRVLLQLESPEPDIQEMIDKDAPTFHAVNAQFGLLLWGLSVFRYEQKPEYSPSSWRERLATAQGMSSLVDGSVAFPDHSADARAYIASVCIRDHWGEMEEADRMWCGKIVCDAIERTCDKYSELERVQRYEMSGDRPAAWAVSYLIVKVLLTDLQLRVLDALAKALTHGVDEVVAFACSGVGENLWQTYPELAHRILNALALRARLLIDLYKAERKVAYVERRPLEVLESEVRPQVRSAIIKREAIADRPWESIDFSGWIGAQELVRILSACRSAIDVPAAIEFHAKAAATIRQWWDRRHRRSDDSEQIPYDIQPQLTTLIERFVLKCEFSSAVRILEPLIAAIDEQPREVGMLLSGIVVAEDQLKQTENFWAIWQLFADGVCRASWLAHVDDRKYLSDQGLLSHIFLGNWWKEGVRHWQSLEGYEQRVHALFEQLPPSATVLEAYTRFLYTIGGRSLPAAFERIANRLQHGEPNQMLSKSNTIFMLEAILRRHVYGRPFELKVKYELRNAVLFLLDTLVEMGSSAAYRMRDDFVTPSILES